MNDYEKLHKICQTIGIDYIEFDERWIYVNEGGGGYYISMRDLIFTPEFIEKLHIHLSRDGKIMTADRKIRDIMDNLDNPVDYLYNLLELGTHN